MNSRVSRNLLAKAARAVPLLGSLVRLLVRRVKRRAAVAELHSIDPRTLKDTGLHRADIWSIADAYARGERYLRADRRERD